MYVSWWQRMKGAQPGYPQDGDGNGGEDKPMRFGDTEGAGLGEFDITVAGLTATTTGFGNVKSWGSWPDPSAAWHRGELFVDRVAGIADMWVDGELCIGSSWLVNDDDGGPFEFRPEGDWLFVQPGVGGTTLDTGGWQNVTIHWSASTTAASPRSSRPGGNVEIGEGLPGHHPRARRDLQRDTWQTAPGTSRTSEVQGDW